MSLRSGQYNGEHISKDPTQSEMATTETLLDHLKRLYWEAAEREICSMIMAFKEISTYHPEAIACEEDNELLDGENYGKIFDLWSPKLPWSTLSFIDPAIYQRAKEAAKDHFAVTLKHRRARYFLQSSGFLDVDISHDYTDPFLPTYYQSCCVEVLPDTTGPDQILRVVYCRGCFLAIRSVVYYECQEGCKDEQVRTWDILLKHELIRVSNSVNFPSERTSKRIGYENAIGEKLSGDLAPVRLCGMCVSDPEAYLPCSRSHLKKISVPRRHPNRKVRKFQQKLDRINDKAIHENDVQLMIDTAVSVFAEIARIFPAGPAHCALMFGPLVIENGVPNTHAGALITTRPIPCLSYSRATSLLYKSEDLISGRPMTSALIFFENETSHQRRLQPSPRAVEDRGFLASIKQVYGGAFSGYREELHQKEKTVIDLLVKVSESLTLDPFKSVTVNRKALHSAADVVLEALQELIGDGVDTHLERLSAKLLQRETVLRWNARSNSCQDFTNSLLRNDFTGLYPEANQGHIVDTEATAPRECPWARYLFCFKDRIDPPQVYRNNTQHRSIIWQFYETSRNNLDLIEFTERTLEQVPADKSTSWEILLQRPMLASAKSCTAEALPKSTIVDALWELPRDTMSLLQTQLLRRRERLSSPQGYALTKEEWILNRLRVLQQLDIFACLAGGMGLAWLAEFEQYPEDLEELIFPHSDMYGTMHASERIKVVQLGPVKVARIYGRQLRMWKQVGSAMARDGYLRKFLDMIQDITGQRWH
ncbi:hypothetical protein MMC30_006843 [Trapelia coarctata]|nr:hypothetical protein [Trapelia coarctata]